MKVITISGKAGSGKDTFAEMLKSKFESSGERVLLTHYADLLKYICHSFFGWDGKKDEKGRKILQYVGTDVVRAISPNFWAQFIAEILDFFPDKWDLVIIPDCRFPNEIGILKSRGHDVTTINVVRDDFQSELTEEQLSHVSENALDGYQFDYIAYNNGTLDELDSTASMMGWVIGKFNDQQLVLNELFL